MGERQGVYNGTIRGDNTLAGKRRGDFISTNVAQQHCKQIIFGIDFL